MSILKRKMNDKREKIVNLLYQFETEKYQIQKIPVKKRTFDQQQKIQNLGAKCLMLKTNIKSYLSQRVI